MAMLDVPALVTHLDVLAASTWHKVHVGPARGLVFREESLTDHNLFELDQVHDQLTVYKFDSNEESSNGADFDWWIGNNAIGWVGLRFQAKKLDDGVYAQLGHRVRGERQYDILIREASSDGMWPLYCLYNGWDGGWPAKVQNRACPKQISPSPLEMFPSKGSCTHVAIEHFGCSVVPAQAVRSRHRGPRYGRLALESYLANSLPWSRIFASPVGAGTGTSRLADSAVLGSIESSLASLLSSQDLADQGGYRQAELPSWVEAVRQGQRSEVRYQPKPRALALLEVPSE